MNCGKTDLNGQRLFNKSQPQVFIEIKLWKPNDV